MKKPLILVTNDDGLFAPGIKALIEVAKEFGEVIVVAPDSPQSAQSNAITISDPIRLREVKSEEGVTIYDCSGTPVDCVKLAKDILLKNRKVDLCVSGINHGSNKSINVIYSGTMSAAMEGAIGGIPSIGFSLLDFSFKADFEPSKHYVRALIKTALEDKAIDCKLWNVNIPKLPLSEIKGIKFCRQAKANWIEKYHEVKDPRGQKYYWLDGSFQNEDKGTDTDIWALDNGYVSVVPCMYDLTDYSKLKN